MAKVASGGRPSPTVDDYLQTIYSNFGMFFGAFFGVAGVVFGAAYFVCRSKAARR